jgi:hypothetical protein
MGSTSRHISAASGSSLRYGQCMPKTLDPSMLRPWSMDLSVYIQDDLVLDSSVQSTEYAYSRFALAAPYQLEKRTLKRRPLGKGRARASKSGRSHPAWRTHYRVPRRVFKIKPILEKSVTDCSIQRSGKTEKSPRLMRLVVYDAI